MKTNINGSGKDLLELIATGTIDIDITKSDILDLGFGNPSSYFMLDFELGLKSYLGVDIIRENELNVDLGLPSDSYLPEDTVLDSFSRKPYNQYKLFHKYNYQDDYLIPEDIFKHKFRFKFETPILDFFKDYTEKKKYDIVVLSDILHLINLKNQFTLIVENALKLLKRDGLIFIKVFEKPYNSIPFFSKEEINNFDRLFKVMVKKHTDSKIIVIGKPIKSF